MTTGTRALATIAIELSNQTVILEEARRDEQMARQSACSAVNRVNELQKEFDEAVAAMKKTAPRDTDWTRKPGLPAT